MLELFSKTALNPLTIHFLHCLLLWYSDTYIRCQVTTAKQATVRSPLLGNNSLTSATIEELWKRYFLCSLCWEAISGKIHWQKLSCEEAVILSGEICSTVSLLEKVVESSLTEICCGWSTDSSGTQRKGNVCHWKQLPENRIRHSWLRRIIVWISECVKWSLFVCFCEIAIALYLLVVMSCKNSVTPVSHPNYHSFTWLVL
jgi:hypothetical protein